MTEFLDHFTSGEVLKTQSVSLNMPYSSFEGLLAFIRKQVSKEEYLNLFYYHATMEKCITAWKGRDINSGLYLFAKIDQIDRSLFPQPVKHGADVVYLAGKAYYEYVTEQYDEAYSRLQTAITEIKAQKDITPEFVSNLYEQNLNMMRIHFKTKDAEKITAKALELLKSILFNINDSPTLDPSLADNTPVGKNTWFYYIMDNFVLGASTAYQNESEQRKSLYTSVLGELIREDSTNPCLLPEMMDGIKMIYHAQKGEMDIFNLLINAHFDSISHLPALMKKSILTLYLDWVGKAHTDIIRHKNYDHFEAVVYEFMLEHKLIPRAEAAA